MNIHHTQVHLNEQQRHLICQVKYLIFDKGLTAYVDSLYSTYLVVLIRLSYDDSIYLVIENMTYD